MNTFIRSEMCNMYKDWKTINQNIKWVWRAICSIGIAYQFACYLQIFEIVLLIKL